jgi:RNA polymerase sigma-70 factor (ECF subfamily)
MSADEFDAVFVAMYRPLLRYAQRRLLSQELAEFVVSEALFEAWTVRQRNREITLPWLYRVAHRKIVEQYRHSDGRAMLLASPGGNESGAAEAVAGLDRKALVDALNALRSKEREAILLTHWEGLTLDDLAVALGCRPSTARRILARAMQRVNRRVARSSLTAPSRPVSSEEVGDVVNGS